MLSVVERHEYQQRILIPGFKPLLNKPIMSVLYDIDSTSLIATNMSARSIGLSGWEDSAGLSYQDVAGSETLLAVFKSAFQAPTNEAIHKYCTKIFRIQQQVYKQQIVINYIDILPYNDEFKYYYISCMPIFHPNGEVVALQSFANVGQFWGVQDQVSQLLGKKEALNTVSYHLTKREHEILFLLSNGVTQEEIGQILDISRGTVSNIISRQLCAKFGIERSNTKELSQIAVHAGIHKNMPSSLCRPNVIILNKDYVLC